METRKVLVKTAYALIGILALVLVGLSFYQQQQIRKLSRGTDTEISGKDEPTASPKFTADGALPQDDSSKPPSYRVSPTRGK